MIKTNRYDIYILGYLLKIVDKIEDRGEIVVMEDCIAESDPEMTG